MNGGTEGTEAAEGTAARARRLLVAAVASVASFPCVPSVPAVAADFSSSAIGTFSSQEFNLGVGARGIAMGEAVTAVADDVTAIHWNPAGLALIPTGSASFMHSVYLGDITYDYAAYGHRVGERSVLAASAQLFDFGSIERRDVSNAGQGSFHPRSTLYSLAFAQNVHEIEEGGDITAGFTGKWLHSKIVDSADAYALDFGFLVKVPGDVPSQVGFAAQNLGVGPKFDVDRDRLPFQMKGGTALFPGHWALSLELVAPRGNNVYGAGGVEYRRGWSRTLTGSLRAGYNSLTTANGPPGGLHAASFGVGVELTGFSFDYAVVPFGDLGATHQLSINYSLPTFEED